MLKEKLLEELNRYNAINRYTQKLVFEQDMGADAAAAAVPPADPLAGTPPPADPMAAGADPMAAGTDPMATGADPAAGAVPPADPMAAGAEVPATAETEEIDITDLVNMTKSIKNEMDKNKDEGNSVIQK